MLHEKRGGWESCRSERAACDMQATRLAESMPCKSGLRGAATRGLSSGVWGIVSEGAPIEAEVDWAVCAKDCAMIRTYVPLDGEAHLMHHSE